MFVHSCWCMVLFWFECIGFEFKIHLNSNSLSIVWKRKREKKKRIERGNTTRRPNLLPPSLFSPRPSPPPQPARSLTPLRPRRPSSRARRPAPTLPAQLPLSPRRPARVPLPSLTSWPHESVPSPSFPFFLPELRCPLDRSAARPATPWTVRPPRAHQPAAQCSPRLLEAMRRAPGSRSAVSAIHFPRRASPAVILAVISPKPARRESPVTSF